MKTFFRPLLTRRHARLIEATLRVCFSPLPALTGLQPRPLLQPRPDTIGQRDTDLAVGHHRTKKGMAIPQHPMSCARSWSGNTLPPRVELEAVRPHLRFGSPSLNSDESRRERVGDRHGDSALNRAISDLDATVRHDLLQLQIDAKNIFHYALVPIS